MGDLHIRIDEAVEAEAALVLADMGLTVDQAVQAFLRRIAQEKSLPLTPNAETRAALEASWRGEGHRVDGVAALLADLNADD